MILLASSPSPLWFATRGAGIVTLLLLTGVVALGILTAGSAARSRVWPRFVSAGLHRNLSLFALAFLGAHIVLAIADPYAQLGWKDAAIPFVSNYRPFWLGLGVIAGELVLALVITSALRPLLGFRAWKTIHWLAYASWPVAILHALGTGTDAPLQWNLALVAACALVVIASILWRVGPATGQYPALRSGLPIGIAVAVMATAVFVADGPLRPGWALRAGTPPWMIYGFTPTPKATAKPTPTPDPRVTQDQVAGSWVQGRLTLTDQRDPTLQFVVRPPASGEYGWQLAVVHSGTVGCIAATSVYTTSYIAATCGTTTVQIVLYPTAKDGTVTGRVIIHAK